MNTNEQRDYKYKFSIIMAVYNVEKYLDEAVDSLIAQTLDFKSNVQLILVDDGSPDGSGAICDKYARLYPDNVVVVHKENGGVSSARNVGLAYAEGKYVNFMDPDDMLTPGTLESVADFFDRSYEHTNVTAIPMNMFGAMNGSHYLNDKFKKGTRVINLQKEYTYFQLSSSCAFFKHNIAKAMHFDETLTVAEDAQQVLKILIDMPTLGVVSGVAYRYRKHTDSALYSTQEKSYWYNDYLDKFVCYIMDYAREKYGYIPRFVQNALMNNMAWRLTEKTVPKALTPDELARYKSKLLECISYIDEDIVVRQKNCSSDILIKLIASRYPSDRFVTYATNDILYGFDSALYHRFSKNTVRFEFLDIDDSTVTLTARQVYIDLGNRISDVFIRIGDAEIHADSISTQPAVTLLGDEISHMCACRFTVQRSDINALPNSVEVYTVVDGVTVRNATIKYGNHFPISAKYKNSCFFEKGILVCRSGDTVAISSADAKTARKYEKRFEKELWRSNKLGERKAVLARALARVYKATHKKPLWIVSDRYDKIGDNGEAMFRYLCSSKVKAADYVFAIARCPGYDTMKKIGKVVDRESLKYKILHLACDAIVSSHADDFVTNPFVGYSEPYKDIITRKKFVFLQHGVIKDDLSGWLNRYNKNIYGFITSAKGEWDSIVYGSYHYTPERIWLTGLPRFDRLYNDEQRLITLMPTWRKYLMTRIENSEGMWKESEGFTESRYFRFYNDLINDDRVLSAAEKHGYKVCFMPHPTLMNMMHLFKKDPRVDFFAADAAYRDVYARSNLVLTDFSSAVFDFAYLRKPVVYAQFDRDEIFKGDHVYTEGYFDYERDGFGEVTYDYESTVQLLIDYIEGDCKLKPLYRERIDNFFAFNDKNNCKRIVDKLLEPDNK